MLFTRPLSIVVLLSVAVVCLFLSPAAAQWKANGVPVCATVGSRGDLAVIPDGTGGFFASWYDTRDEATNQTDIYLQRVDMFGYPLWINNGIAPNAGVTAQLAPALADDGAGGVFVVWSQGSGPTTLDLYAQRYDDSGNALWTPGGILVCNATDTQYLVTAVSDGSGGVWLAWQDFRYGAADPDVIVNRIDASGNLTWGTSGQSVCSAVGFQRNVRIVSDGLGGCIVAWSDLRGSAYDIYAQRVDSANFIQWVVNGVLVNGATNDQSLDDMVADGLGGAILVWDDSRTGAGTDIYAQRVDGTGANQWASNGVPICGATDIQFDARLTADAAGGAVIVWSDGRDPGIGIYADYIDAAGATQWAWNGKPIAAIGGGIIENAPSVASTGDGVVIAWADDRSGDPHLFAQRLTYGGVEMWTPAGVEVTDAPNGVDEPVTLSDGFGGAVLVWNDGRNGRNDVFAQRLEPVHGEWGQPEPVVWSAGDNPGDQGGYVDLEWWASDRDKQPNTLIAYYSTWRATDSPFATAGDALATTLGKSDGEALRAAVHAAEETWPDATVVTSPGDVARDFDGEAIWVEQGPRNVPVFWEWMSNQVAYYQPGYSYLAPTRADSTGTGTATHYFKVIAHTLDQYVFWESQYVSGHSVDNLAPGSPLMLTATRVGNYVRLDWDPSGLGEPDFGQYVVYRATSSGVTPAPLYLLDTTTEETLWDHDTPPGTPYYYIVTASDLHGNESLPSNEANVDGVTTGVTGGVPALTTLQVAPNVPNPFGDATALHVGMPGDGDVSLEVFDVAGRRVFSRTYPGVTRGWHDIVFDGHDGSGHPLAGGVYFYRVHAAGATLTRKMVLTR